MDVILRIGIAESGKFDVFLHGTYTSPDGKKHTGHESLLHPVLLKADNESCFFEIDRVTIGKEFHWQSQERQRFTGDLECVETGNGLAAVNHIGIEDYLVSVISSEMNANAAFEMLKAQAVIARSWALRQKTCKHKAGKCLIETENMHLRWYENDSHLYYDLCADDHCQRYYGLSRAGNPAVSRAVKETAGEVLMYKGELCDARYHKSCGGITEKYSTCWADIDFPYLQPVRDYDKAGLHLPEGENEIKNFILSDHPAFCNPRNMDSCSLNDFDAGIQSYRWQQEYSVGELSELVFKRSGMDFGEITELVSVHRGPSGRIDKLLIKGRRMEKTVGKELEIRKFLSETHLYSSAFVVEKTDAKFILKGAGWGHGVGLCQTGAAAMAAQGYNYKQILRHYYKGAEVRKNYYLSV